MRLRLGLSVVGLAIRTVALYVVLRPPPPPSFIDRLGGREIASPWPMEQPLSNGVTYFNGYPVSFFAFNGDPNLLKKGILKELKLTDPISRGYMSVPGEDGSVVHLYDKWSALLPDGSDLVVVVLRRQTWLERQISNVKRAMSGGP